MWKYSSENDTDHILFHDSFITDIDIDGNDLILKFDDGFWLLDSNKQNPYGKILRTGKSQTRLSNFEIIDIYLFSEMNFFRKTLLITRKNISLVIFLSKIKSNIWKTEIIEEFFDKNNFIFYGFISEKKHTKEIEFKTMYSKITYYWNEIKENREW